MELQNIKKYFSIVLILLIGLFGIIILTTGIYFKFNKLKSGNNYSIFLFLYKIYSRNQKSKLLYLRCYIFL